MMGGGSGSEEVGEGEDGWRGECGRGRGSRGKRPREGGSEDDEDVMLNEGKEVTTNGGGGVESVEFAVEKKDTKRMKGSEKEGEEAEDVGIGGGMMWRLRWRRLRGEGEVKK
ncbi:hypothetical protein CesoFtcFv8_001760 [Champsocephalus esox]|uniref:Uncharacterized protein n=1 Tax=Champsocephalus esox TaxID=159716 RepID=A0AAN8HDA3_9TELE|nr:hypothetical protein CesoFtcFv8_001760 [Champsocephalus esox]